jgi:RNA methyltransferase, TrmH family
MPVEAVTSTRNAGVRAAAALVRSRRRRETGRHLVEGPHAVGEALAAGVVETLYATGEALDGLGASPPPDVEVTEVADHVLAHIADTTTPQGLVAVATDVTVGLDALPTHGLVVVLDRLAEPGNVGGIVRTADAAGAAAVVCTAGTADVLGPKAVRAAAGSTYHVPIVVGSDLADVARAAHDHGRRLLGLDAGAASSVLDLGPGAEPLALVLGNEAHGLDETARGLLDGLVAVPILGGAESLNVAAAAAVAIYAAATGPGPGRDRNG